MSDLQIRTIRSHERDAVLDLLKEWLNDRTFFARYFHHDPEFRDDLCFVASDGDRIVSTFQVFRKQVRVGSKVLQVAGVGNVFTTEAYRQRHIASQLLTHGLTAMEQHGFDVSLLFATRLQFYGALGWRSHVRNLLFLEPASLPCSGPYTIAEFSDLDLDGVRQVYDRYSARFSGTTVRDEAYWNGQLRYAGNPQEDFLVARHGGEVVAYARGAALYGFYVLMEHGYLPGRADALVQLICRLHGTEAGSLPGSITHLSIEPQVQEELRRRGVSLNNIEDGFWMWRVINPRQLATKLGVSLDDVAADDFFFRILPPSESVYWIADRF